MSGIGNWFGQALIGLGALLGTAVLVILIIATGVLFVSMAT
jgi:hypothetical protein